MVCLFHDTVVAVRCVLFDNVLQTQANIYFKTFDWTGIIK